MTSDASASCQSISAAMMSMPVRVRTASIAGGSAITMVPIELACSLIRAMIWPVNFRLWNVSERPWTWSNRWLR